MKRKSSSASRKIFKKILSKRIWKGNPVGLKQIVQRISLEGGQAIKAQLDAIGDAGKKAFSDLQGAVASNRSFGNIGNKAP